MQTAAQLAYVPQSGPARAPETPPLAVFHFASDAALDRALALTRTQPWIASCSVDRARRTLRVELSSGGARACARAARTLH